MNENMANREVVNVVFRNYSDKKPFHYADYMNAHTVDFTCEPAYAYGGKGHPTRITYHGNRAGKVKFETQIQPMKLWALATGGELSSAGKYLKREVLTAAANKLTLSEVPDGGVVNVYSADDDCGTEVNNTVSAKEVTLSGSDNTGDFVAYYTVALSTGVKKLSIKNTSFPKAFVVDGETTYKTEDDEEVPYKVTYYKCCPTGALSLSQTNSGDPATLSIECDLMVDGDGNIADMLLIEDDD